MRHTHNVRGHVCVVTIGASFGRWAWLPDPQGSSADHGDSKRYTCHAREVDIFVARNVRTDLGEGIWGEARSTSKGREVAAEPSL